MIDSPSLYWIPPFYFKAEKSKFEGFTYVPDSEMGDGGFVPQEGVAEDSDEDENKE